MAFVKKKNIEIPADAVIMNEKQALHYTLKVIEGWDKSSEV